MPTKPAGCLPANSVTLTEEFTAMSVPGALLTKTSPSVKRASTVKPFTKASLCSAMITAGSAANGLVSIALTNIAIGVDSTAGILLNGRVRNAVHKPELTRFATTSSRAIELSSLAA